MNDRAGEGIEVRKRQLDDQEDRLRFITDSLPVLISYVGSDGRYRFVNRMYETWFGVEQKDLIGRTVRDVIGDLAWEHVEPKVERALSGETVRWTATLDYLSVGKRNVQVDYVPHRNEGGDVVGFYALVQDITPRLQAEQALRESEERFRTLADNISQFAWIADETGWIFWYNKRWFEYTGTTLEEMEGWGWKAVHHPEHVDRVTEKFRRHIERGEAWEDIFPLRSKDGSYGWFLSRAMPIRDENGSVVRWFGTNTDFTERMKMEEALREADRRKDEFLATLAHELRNPLAPIRTGLELLRKTVAGDDERAAETLGVMERQTELLVRLVDDLMDVSRITRGKIELRIERHSVREIIDGALEATRSTAEDSGLEIETNVTDESLEIVADAARLSQVLVNLISNAIKYTPPPGKVAISAERLGDEIVLRVRDTGVGIELERQEKIFEMFHQLEQPRERRLSGLGIGLTLARSLVELHGGTISVESEGVGQGSVFTVRVPAGRLGEPRVARETTPASDERPLRVFVVDDNEDAAFLVSRFLESLGHETETFHRGTEMLKSAGDSPPDAIVLDIGMPGMSGYEVAERVREEPWGQEVLLVAVTGWGQEEDRARTAASGFDHHFVKPVKVSDLRELFSGRFPSGSS